uniref:Serine/arginine repetitive matrix 1 n=1 Tax=Oryzias melastigma TaxID=30732 RepID=A0A3B3DIV0_ORYME
MDAGFFRGTSAEQDNRFSNKQKKLLKQLKFAECLDKKVDMTKVNLEVIKPWITQRVTEILGFEDDVVIEFIFNQLEEKVMFLIDFPFVLVYLNICNLYELAVHIC